jgi:ankyrin repeat protein
MPSLPSPAPAKAAGQNISAKAIIRACLTGNLAQLRRWGYQNVRVKTAETLLQAVSNGASFEVLSCLVRELGADVNRRDDHGCTALAVAAYLGYHDTVRYLVEDLGADVNITDNDGRGSWTRPS